MGIFSLFRKPIYVDDEVFGNLERKSLGKNNTECYFHTYSLLFVPAGRKIECEIKGCTEIGFNGPTYAQREFFLQIKNTYASLIEKIIPFLNNKLKAVEPYSEFKDFNTAFQLVYLLIPDCTTAPVEWEWAFEPVFDNSYTVTVCMRDATPIDVEVVA